MFSHQVDSLCNGPNIAARFQALNAAGKDGSHITSVQDFSLHQVLKEGERGRPIGNCDGLSAAAEEVNHGYLHPPTRRFIKERNSRNGVQAVGSVHSLA